MITIVKQDSDLKITGIIPKDSSGQEVARENIKELSIKISTVESGALKYILFSDKDLDEDGTLYIEKKDLLKLEQGQLYAQYNITVLDPNFSDGEQNSEFREMLNYYLEGRKNFSDADTGEIVEKIISMDGEIKVIKDNYASKKYVDEAIGLIDLTPYATKEEVEDVNGKVVELGRITYTSDVVDEKIELINKSIDEDIDGVYEDLYQVSNNLTNNYYTKEDIEGKSYLTEHQSLADYATKTEVSEVNDKLNNINYTTKVKDSFMGNVIVRDVTDKLRPKAMNYDAIKDINLKDDNQNKWIIGVWSLKKYVEGYVAEKYTNQLKTQVVNYLPDTGSANTLYFTPQATPMLMSLDLNDDGGIAPQSDEETKYNTFLYDQDEKNWVLISEGVNKPSVDYYTKEQINEILNGLTTLNVEIVETLPTENISTTTFYLVLSEDQKDNNIYDEYLYINDQWEKVGSTSVDLSKYYTKEEVDDKTKDYLTAESDTIEIIKTDIDNVKDDIEDIRLFKFPNLTIFGSPTINNGQISNFSASNYFQFPFIVDFKEQPFVINFSFTTGSDIETQQNIIDSEFGLAIAIKNKHIIWAGSTNGTSWDLGENVQPHIILTPNTTYDVAFGNQLISGQPKFFMNVSTDGGENYDPYYGYPKGYLFPKQIIIGKGIDNTHIFTGSINLNRCKLTIANKVVWSGMDDAGLATRLAVDMSNIDEAGRNYIKGIAESVDVPASKVIRDITQEEYDALDGNYEDVIYNITDAGSVDLDNYYTKEEVDGLISDVTSGYMQYISDTVTNETSGFDSRITDIESQLSGLNDVLETI